MSVTMVPGLPSNWPELIAAACADLSNDDFEIVWRQVGKTVRFLARDMRGQEAATGEAMATARRLYRGVSPEVSDTP